MEDNNFSVYTYAPVSTNSTYSSWGHELKMIIEKNGVSLCLNEDEIRQLVKSLPRTIGGSY